MIQHDSQPDSQSDVESVYVTDSQGETPPFQPIKLDSARFNPAVLGRVKVQLLPIPSGRHFPKQRSAPTLKSVLSNYTADQLPEISAAMADSLIFGLAAISDTDHRVGHHGEMTKRMLAQRVGRCFWSWADIPNFTDFVAPMGPLSLRPTSLFPEDMQVISPRMSCNLLTSSNRAIERVIKEFMGSTPKYSLGTALALTTYGAVQDAALPSFHRLPERLKRNGYSAQQSLVIDFATSEGVLPFAMSIIRETLYEDDLAKRLKEIEPAVRERLAELAKPLEEGEVRDALIDGEIPYAKACDKVIRGSWDFPLRTVVAGEVAEGDPDEDILHLTCRAVIVVATADGRHQTLPTKVLLALAILSGVSPAAYVRFAIQDIERRGVTYMTPQQVGELRGMVLEYAEDWDGMERKRAEVLIKELAVLEREFDRASMRVEMRSERVGEWMKERGVGFAREWFDTGE